MIKLKSFDNGIIKIEDGKLTVCGWNPHLSIKQSLEQYKAINDALDEIIIQPERSKREDNIKHCANCICSCDCRVFDIEHSDSCPVNIDAVL